jgi:hypothetical protein
MADMEWTVKDLTEALKTVPVRCEGLLRDGAKRPSGNWESGIRQGLGRVRRDGSTTRPIGS